MCGIIGVVNIPSISTDEFIALRDSLTHRGPDDAGAWVDRESGVFLGQRRLSILDLSSAGHQPMVSQCGRFVIVFNGEIYNYLELKRELQDLGMDFNGSGDTEVVLSAYRQWGENCLLRFNGMFAFALWDQGTADVPPSMFMARDRVGKKPLYYAQQGRQLAFASELKAIPKSMQGAIDLQALNHYLALGYVPGCMCIVSGVRKLPPAHALRYRPDTGELKTWQWWRLPVHYVNSSVSTDDLVDEGEALLRDAVKLRMRSDVPIGILLSGGLDSSMVVACAAQSSSKEIKTFTMGLPGSGLDESGYAGIVAKHFGTEHHVLEVPPTSLVVLDEMAPFIDEPIADSSQIPAYLISRLTAQYVKVALGGDGGDELFGGYADYTTAFADQARLAMVPSLMLRWLSTLAGKLPPGVSGRNRLSALRGGPFQSMVWGSPYFDAAARRRILSKEAVSSLGDNFFAPELFRLALFQTGVDPVDCMTRTHFGSILPDDFMVKVDRMSMAVSIELRCPFLDVRLIEYAFGRIPSDWKVQGTEGRRLQKRLGKRFLPQSLDVNRKQGFSVPMNEWLRGPDTQWRDRLSGGLPETINTQAVHSLVAGHARGRTNGSRLFSLIMLSLAMRNISCGG